MCVCCSLELGVKSREREREWVAARTDTDTFSNCRSRTPKPKLFAWIIYLPFSFCPLIIEHPSPISLPEEEEEVEGTEGTVDYYCLIESSRDLSAALFYFWQFFDYFLVLDFLCGKCESAHCSFHCLVGFFFLLNRANRFDFCTSGSFVAPSIEFFFAVVGGCKSDCCKKREAKIQSVDRRPLNAVPICLKLFPVESRISILFCSTSGTLSFSVSYHFSVSRRAADATWSQRQRKKEEKN